MTKEEPKLEAIKYLENFKDCANCKNRWGDCADQLDEYCLENGCCFATPKEQDIYLAGAEPREKQIAELKETCNKWFEHLKNREEELLNELNNQNAKYNKQIEDLEKENAELKETVLQFQKDSYCGLCHFKTKAQLKQSKEIIKTFLGFAEAFGYSPSMDKFITEAEQFLSEVEK